MKMLIGFPQRSLFLACMHFLAHRQIQLKPYMRENEIQMDDSELVVLSMMHLQNMA
jgi:hypothetical protein